MFSFTVRAVGALFGVVASLIAASARAQLPAIRGEVTLGRGTVVGLVDPDGTSAPMSGLLVGGSLGVRFGRLAVGGSAEKLAELLGHNESFLAAHAGWSLAGKMGRLTVSGEAGRHSYNDMGDGILAGYHATSASLPFVGGRFVANVGSSLFVAWLAVRQDLGTALAADADTGDWRVGGTAVCVGFGLGFDGEMITHPMTRPAGAPSPPEPSLRTDRR